VQLTLCAAAAPLIRFAAVVQPIRHADAAPLIRFALADPLTLNK
jgi:hypothetical protein